MDLEIETTYGWNVEWETVAVFTLQSHIPFSLPLGFQLSHGNPG